MNNSQAENDLPGEATELVLRMKALAVFHSALAHIRQLELQPEGILILAGTLNALLIEFGGITLGQIVDETADSLDNDNVLLLIRQSMTMMGIDFIEDEICEACGKVHGSDPKTPAADPETEHAN